MCQEIFKGESKFANPHVNQGAFPAIPPSPHGNDFCGKSFLDEAKKKNLILFFRLRVFQKIFASGGGGVPIRAALISMGIRER